DLQRGTSHAFGKSRDWDVLFRGARYAPKAVIGLAAGKVTGQLFGPNDFKGGLGTKCFHILEANGFIIVSKSEIHPFPDEIVEKDQYIEGAVERVPVNRYERDPKARAKAIRHHGVRCRVCRFDFARAYGAIGEGFIHVHHTI